MEAPVSHPPGHTEGLGDTVAEVVTALAYTEAARPPDKEQHSAPRG